MKIILTHYVNQEPSKHGWCQLPFITQKEENDNYFFGFEFQLPFSKKCITQYEELNYYRKLKTPLEIDLSQSVWISPECNVFLAEDPFIGEKIFIENSEYPKNK